MASFTVAKKASCNFSKMPSLESFLILLCTIKELNSTLQEKEQTETFSRSMNVAYGTGFIWKFGGMVSLVSVLLILAKASKTITARRIMLRKNP